MKLTFFETTPEEKRVFTDLLSDKEIVFVDAALKPTNINSHGDISGTEVLSVFVGSDVSKEVIDSLPNLKLIVTRSTGFDHIDVAHANTKGIVVCNVPGYGSYTVAEFTFALMLNLSRNIAQAQAQLKQHGDFNPTSLRGFDLRGKTLGILGTGRIGKNVAHIAASFGMKLIGYDAFPDKTFAKETGLEYMPLTDVLSHADIVTIHVPYNKDSHHLINKENIKLMKRGAHLVNTARGEIVDTEALLWALSEGIIAEAALDVLEGEKDLKEEVHLLADRPESIKNMRMLAENHALINLPQVVVTPHIAFDSDEAIREIMHTTAQNIINFSSGNTQNAVKIPS
jgi:D-lactate dehydrogenase